MILIKRIVGESLDLETGEEISRGLLLTNGISEVVVPVDDEFLKTVILLMHEMRGGPPMPEAQPVQETPAPSAVVKNNVPTPQKVPATVAPFVMEPRPDVMEEHLASGAVADFMGDLESGDFAPEEDFDPGETYEDPDTGVDSI